MQSEIIHEELEKHTHDGAIPITTTTTSNITSEEDHPVTKVNDHDDDELYNDKLPKAFNVFLKKILNNAERLRLSEDAINVVRGCLANHEPQFIEFETFTDDECHKLRNITFNFDNLFDDSFESDNHNLHTPILLHIIAPLGHNNTVFIRELLTYFNLNIEQYDVDVVQKIIAKLNITASLLTTTFNSESLQELEPKFLEILILVTLREPLKKFYAQIDIDYDRKKQVFFDIYYTNEIKSSSANWKYFINQLEQMPTIDLMDTILKLKSFLFKTLQFDLLKRIEKNKEYNDLLSYFNYALSNYKYNVEQQPILFWAAFNNLSPEKKELLVNQYIPQCMNKKELSSLLALGYDIETMRKKITKNATLINELCSFQTYGNFTSGSQCALLLLTGSCGILALTSFILDLKFLTIMLLIITLAAGVATCLLFVPSINQTLAEKLLKEYVVKAFADKLVSAIFGKQMQPTEITELLGKRDADSAPKSVARQLLSFICCNDGHSPADETAALEHNFGM